MRPAAIQFDQINKSFYGIPVLKNVSFEVPVGSVMGLVGENGAGKSTLMNILVGNLSADSGKMKIHGESYQPNNPLDSYGKGVALVHQELNLFPNLSVAENLFLTDFPKRKLGGIRWIDRKALLRDSEIILSQVDPSIDPSVPVENLSPGQRQLVEIARALKGRPKLIAFDEPTTSLTEPEREKLFDIVEQLKIDGCSIIYISHHLGEVLRLCDQIAVLRDGEVKAHGQVDDFSVPLMISLMIGRSLESLFPSRDSFLSEETLLEAKELSQPGAINSISLCLKRGEILGISGLMGSGRTELARILFGLEPFSQGSITVNGKQLTAPDPRKCIRNGMAFLTEDRGKEGLLENASIEDNLGLVRMEEFSRSVPGVLDLPRMKRELAGLARLMKIDSRDIQQQTVKTLSGGNQQKVVLGKWLLNRADILILDEPTRGVDIGARYEIYLKIIEQAAAGTGILMISSDLEELIGLCDRILVMARGEIRAEIRQSDFDRREILRLAFGEERLQ